ncbi:hypothetical protein [Paludisphaera mucosa]|uniref:Uncharacterized protein n=1 Tax=Paludisphaera mucosa TaxID=3030827 RepID=A0ABT6FEW8_9BACT|nr:hypothetical protein [Paludisphaera mucosa]MDG3006123.1 hypothetical protein [Paludisphaera mucosa]
MNTQPTDWVVPGDSADPKPSPNRTIQLVVGLLAFAGAGLAFYFLLLQGGLLLGIGFLVEILSMIAPPAGGQGDCTISHDPARTFSI